jgi:16S rRNA (cytidine1402-2'-O)-methyltransferase
MQHIYQPENEVSTDIVFDYKSTFFIVATPIGNLKDITYRAVEILNNVDIIACEDTRYTIRLLARYGIKKKLISHHKYSDNSKDDYILNLLKDGNNIAYVSDAGMPLIADPGNKLVNTLVQNNIKIEVIPGACSVISALVLSNMNLSEFVFGGWMPKKSLQKSKIVKKFLESTNTVAFLESPHRLKKTIDDIYNFFEKEDTEMFQNLNISIAREMTKIHEEILRGNLEQIKNILDKRKIIKGEIVIVFGKK